MIVTTKQIAYFNTYYLMDKAPTLTLDNMIQAKAWTRRKPLEAQCIDMCVAIKHISMYYTRKCIFISSGDDAKGYTMWNLNDH